MTETATVSAGKVNASAAFNDRKLAAIPNGIKVIQNTEATHVQKYSRYQYHRLTTIFFRRRLSRSRVAFLLDPLSKVFGL